MKMGCDCPFQNQHLAHDYVTHNGNCFDEDTSSLVQQQEHRGNVPQGKKRFLFVFVFGEWITSFFCFDVEGEFPGGESSYLVMLRSARF